MKEYFKSVKICKKKLRKEPGEQSPVVPILLVVVAVIICIVFRIFFK